MPRNCDLISRGFKKRFHKNHDSSFWNRRQREVLQGLKDMNIDDQESGCEPRKITLKNSRKMRRSRCYLCLTRGHAYWNCPTKDRREEDKKGKRVINEDTRNEGTNISVPASIRDVIGSDGKGWDEIWYVSDEHPRHMTPNLEVFYKFKREPTCSSAISQNGFDVQGSGEVLVQTKTHKLVIPGALYVPNVDLNILSQSQLESQGFEVIFKDAKCHIKSIFNTSSREDMEEGNTGKGCVINNKTENKEEEWRTSNEEEETLDRDKEKAIRAMMRYYDSLYFKDNIINDGDGQAPTRNDFESLIGFLEMVEEQEIHEGCKDLVIDHFGKLVKWFYTDFMKCKERPNPVKINNTEVCLLDLYLAVKGLGGHGRVTIRNKWVQVADVLGFPSECADDLREYHATHLSLVEAYYGVAKDYSREDFVSEFACGKDTKGIGARKWATEETLQDCSETKAMQMDLDEERGILGKVEYDDGDTLIISLEEDINDGDDEDKNAVTK